MTDTNDQPISEEAPGMERMTNEHMAYDQARLALGDSEQSIFVLTSMVTLLTLEKTRQKSMTAAEALKTDVMRREAWERIPDGLSLAINKWAAELVGLDPDSVLTR